MKPAISATPGKKLQNCILQRTAHLSAICVVTAALAACGGGSGGGAATGGSDIDIPGADEIPDTDVTDIQGIFDPTPDDLDGDGLLNSEEEALGLDPTLVDSDFNGIPDGDEDFDGDGISNIVEAIDETLFDEIPASAPPTADRCSDFSSVNFQWADNCTLREGGTFATSSYSEGVQRIVWCTGFRTGNATTLTAFADGIFGPNTDQAVRDYQTDRALLVDGIVGPETWESLQEELSLIDIISTATNDAHAIIASDNAVDCELNTVQFFNATSEQAFLGWTLASTPGSLDEVPFSSDPPQ